MNNPIEILQQNPELNTTGSNLENGGSFSSMIKDLREIGVPEERINEIKMIQIGQTINGISGVNRWSLIREGEDDYSLIIEKIDEITELIDSKVENRENLTEIERAKKYWHQSLSLEKRIEARQNPRCRISVVVPVFNETVERIAKQIESIKKQSIDPTEYEIIYIVNNDKIDSSEKSQQINLANKNIIDFLFKVNEQNIFVIDKSSQGNEILGCNVGKARDRGVAEASFRFYENGKNGILIQLDADTYLEDRDHFKNVISIMESNSRLIGIAGGVDIESNPDSEDRELFRKKVDRFLLYKKWEFLVDFMEHPTRQLDDTNFIGGHMISKSLETAVVGGVPHLNSAEDDVFGKILKRYAKREDKTVIEMKDSLKVIVSLRDSDRHDTAFKKDFDQIDLDNPTLVENIFIPGLGKKIPLTEDNYNLLVEEVKKNGKWETILISSKWKQLSNVRF